MTPVAIGAAAIGAVAGWWCAPVATARSSLRTWATLAAAVVALWAEVAWLGGRDARNALVVGFAVGFILHSGFRTLLKSRLSHNRS